MTKPHLNIAMCSNDRYFHGLLVTCLSIIVSSDQSHSFNFIVLDGGLSQNSKDTLAYHVNRYSADSKVVFVDIDTSRFQGLKSLFGSTLPYARLLLPELISLPLVLYVDVDFLLLKNVADVFDISLNGSSGLVVQDQIQWQLRSDCPWLDAESEDLNLPYFNSGLMLIPLDVWRKFGYAEKCIQLAMESPDKCTYADQTPLNYVLKKQVEFIDLSWNRRPDKAFLSTDFISERANIHYMASKPWQRFHNGSGFPPWYRFCDTFISPKGDYAADLGFTAARLRLQFLNFVASSAFSKTTFNSLAGLLGKSWDLTITTSAPIELENYSKLYRLWLSKTQQY